MTDFLIGIDDTDEPDSPGTGRLARDLGAALEARGDNVLGVTRHQLLLHPLIPYTSANSAACLLVRSDESDRMALAELVEVFVKVRSAALAEPGVAVVEADKDLSVAADIGGKAQREVLDDVGRLGSLASRAGIELRSTGRGESGLVGAISAVGLRWTGHDGRFIDLDGIRLGWETATVQDLIGQTGVMSVLKEDGEELASEEEVAVDGWLRPSLIGGRPSLVVRRDIARNCWVNAETRKGARYGPRA